MPLIVGTTTDNPKKFFFLQRRLADGSTDNFMIQDGSGEFDTSLPSWNALATSYRGGIQLAMQYNGNWYALTGDAGTVDGLTLLAPLPWMADIENPFDERTDAEKLLATLETNFPGLATARIFGQAQLAEVTGTITITPNPEWIVLSSNGEPITVTAITISSTEITVTTESGNLDNFMIRVVQGTTEFSGVLDSSNQVGTATAFNISTALTVSLVYDAGAEGSNNEGGGSVNSDTYSRPTTPVDRQFNVRSQTDGSLTAPLKVKFAAPLNSQVAGLSYATATGIWTHTSVEIRRLVANAHIILVANSSGVTPSGAAGASSGGYVTVNFVQERGGVKNVIDTYDLNLPSGADDYTGDVTFSINFSDSQLNDTYFVEITGQPNSASTDTDVYSRYVDMQVGSFFEITEFTTEVSATIASRAQWRGLLSNHIDLPETNNVRTFIATTQFNYSDLNDIIFQFGFGVVADGSDNPYMQVPTQQLIRAHLPVTIHDNIAQANLNTIVIPWATMELHFAEGAAVIRFGAAIGESSPEKKTNRFSMAVNSAGVFQGIIIGYSTADNQPAIFRLLNIYGR